MGYLRVFRLVVLMVGFSMVAHAQLARVLLQAVSTNANWQAVSADDLEVMLLAAEQTTPAAAESVPRFGTFYSTQNPNWPPLPEDFNSLPAWDLGNGIWLLADQDFDYVAPAQQDAALHGMAKAMGLANEEASSTFTIDTNGVWLEITNIANGLAYLNLNNATDSVYEILSKTDLTLTNWNIEQEVWPTNPSMMPFAVPELDRTNLFIWARDWTGITSGGNETPEWWFWNFFGTTDLSDTNLDNQGNMLLLDYQNNVDPNIIQFSLQFTNTYLNMPTACGSVTVAGGTPFYEAILVNDTNTADANWQPYTSTNIIASLDSGDGPYTVQVGLRGLPPDAAQTWLGTSLILNTVAPTFTVTNPISSTVSQPMIQLQGLVNETLSKLTFDVSNAVGVITNQQGYWQAVFFDTNRLQFTTNTFQCYDIKLTNGVNTITLHATDLAGNTATTNLNYTLSYAGVTNAPTLSLIWPQPNTPIGGSNVTIQVLVDDATATVTATVNGNTVQGLVERNGLVWLQNVPLGSGTNVVTITATNAAGNMNMTNLTVVQSPVTLTVNPIASGQLNQPLVTVTGAVSDPGQNVWVNGVQASVDGSGNWTANNVPVGTTGTAGLNAQAGPGSDSPLAAQSLNQPQPAMVELANYESSYHSVWTGVHMGSGQENDNIH